MKLRSLFAAALTAFAVTTASAAAPAPGASDSTKVDALWPAESTQVFKLNIKQILSSDIVKKYALNQIKQAMEGKDAQEMMKTLGLDPLKDIDTLSGGLWGEDQNDMHGLIILRGKFDPTKIFEAVDKAIQKDGDKVSIVKEGDTKLVKIVAEKIPEPLYATMADDKTILLATDKKIVMAGVKAADSKSKATIKPELAELVNAMDEKASLFFCGMAGKVGDIPPNPVFDDVEKLKKQLENMVSSSMTLRVTGDISMEMALNMKNTDSADDFGATVKETLDKARVFLPIIGMQAPQAKSIIADLQKMSSKVDGKAIKMNIKITGDAIGKAVGAEE